MRIFLTLAGLFLSASLHAQTPALSQLQAGGQPFSSVAPFATTLEPAAPALFNCLFDGLKGEPAASGPAFERAVAARVVYAGEQHDRPAHHLAQRDLLEALSSARPGVAAGFEMLYTSQQAALDRYLSGAIDAAQFQTEVNWKKTWGFPFELYQPIFETLRAKGLKGLALNAPASLVKKVAISGLESLTPAERAQLPSDMKLTDDPAYLAMLTESFKGHGGKPEDPAAFHNYLDAMMLWNETMAQGVANYLKENPGTQVLVIAGAFHAYDSAIPYGVARRLGDIPQATFILGESTSCPAQLSAEDLNLKADFHWLFPPKP